MKNATKIGRIFLFRHLWIFIREQPFRFGILGFFLNPSFWIGWKIRFADYISLALH